MQNVKLIIATTCSKSRALGKQEMGTSSSLSTTYWAAPRVDVRGKEHVFLAICETAANQRLEQSPRTRSKKGLNAGLSQLRCRWSKQAEHKQASNKGSQHPKNARTKVRRLLVGSCREPTTVVITT
jgi:hypothetical protein